jgi:hypothetical protein
MAASALEILEHLDGIWYAVDRSLMIEAVSHDNWYAFACANNETTNEQAADIIGKPLLDFIATDETRGYYEAMCQAVLSEKRDKISFVYRCDAPDIRRDIRMTISPLHDERNAVNGVLFHNVILAEVQRPPIELLMSNPEVLEEEGIETVNMCSFCKDVEHGDDNDSREWITAEGYYHRGGSSRILLSHGVCPDCHDNLLEPLIG